MKFSALTQIYLESRADTWYEEEEGKEKTRSQMYNLTLNLPVSDNQKNPISKAELQTAQRMGFHSSQLNVLAGFYKAGLVEVSDTSSIPGLDSLVKIRGFSLQWLWGSGN